MTWLLVLVFVSGQPSAHVYAEFTAVKGPECHKLAEKMNEQGIQLQRVAVCVPWRVVQREGKE